MEEERVPLTFNFTAKALRELDELKDLCGITKRVNLIRAALRWLQITTVKVKKEKAPVMFETSTGLQEVKFEEFLERVETLSEEDFRKMWGSDPIPD